MTKRLFLIAVLIAVAAYAQYTLKGAWSSLTAYSAGDVVAYSGNTYVATASSTNIVPGSESPIGSKWAQSSVSLIPDETLVNSWPRLNGGFAAISLNKAQKFSGTTAPGSVAGNLSGDLYTDTTNHHQYVCNAPANTVAPACVSVTTAGWLQTDGGGAGTGNGDPGAYTTVSFSATPTFTVTKNTGQVFAITLTGDVTSSSLDTTGITSSGKPIVTWRICQDGPGSHTFVWPTNVQNAGTVYGTGSSCTSQTFVWDGTNFQALGVPLVTGVSGSAISLYGSTSGSTTVQPAATASGTLTLPARTATVATTTGATTTNNCAKFDASGNVVDAGGVCGGSGTGGMLLASNFDGNTLEGSGGLYWGLFVATGNATRRAGADQLYYVARGVTALHLCIATRSSQPGDGTMTIKMYGSLSGGGLADMGTVVGTVPAAAAAGNYCSSTSVALSTGDSFMFHVENHSVSASAEIAVMQVELQ